MIGHDLYKSAHPEYGRLLRDDDRTAGVTVRPDVLRRQAEVEKYVRGRRFAAVVESSVADLPVLVGIDDRERPVLVASPGVCRFTCRSRRPDR
ncbi:zeta toxin family protein [Streptomyces sp. NPDC001315]|uniref:zeta toxin family protein n=1 Tax=Streptomyces sp. NPDC001315 TaxID=3364562 RepID=UPI0036A584A3